MIDRGIDYGMGQANVDTSNGIRYGVIPVSSLADFAWGEFEPDYGEPTCPECGCDAVPFDGEKHKDYEYITGGRLSACADFACEACEQYLDSEDVYSDEPLGWTLDEDGYSATIDSQNDVFITRSPYFTRAQFCSPCAPGACHLDNPTEEGERAYCLSHDWFEGEKAPYPIYSVETGALVPPGAGK